MTTPSELEVLFGFTGRIVGVVSVDWKRLHMAPQSAPRIAGDWRPAICGALGIDWILRESRMTERRAEDQWVSIKDLPWCRRCDALAQGRGF